MTPHDAPVNHLANSTYRSDVDGLRAIAVLSVIVFHAFPEYLKSGFIGVDIFFVISGYLISTIILRQSQRHEFSFIEFYSRRIRRIFPALLIILVACLVGGWFFLLASEYEQLGKHVAAGAGFVSNFVLVNESGYFDTDAETKPLLHLWSLGIEEQFYILYPFVLWLTGKAKSRLIILISICAIALLSFSANIFHYKIDTTITFYSPQTRVWELMAGALLAVFSIYYSRENPENIRLENSKAIIGIFFLVSGFVLISDENAFPGWIALLPVLGAFFLLWAGKSTWINRRILSNRILIWFGLISFPLYLWHWVILCFGRILAGETLTVETRIILVFFAILLAWITYELVEKPIRFGAQKGRKTICLLLSIIVIGCIGFGIFQQDGIPARYIQSSNDKTMYEQSHFGGWTKCLIVAETVGLGGCQALKKNKPADVVLIGDSHAGHLAPGLKDYFKNDSKNIAILWYGGCYPFFPVALEGVDNFKCPNALIENSLDFAVNDETVRVIVLSGYAALKIQRHRFHEGRKISRVEFDYNLHAFEMGLNTTLGKLAKSGKKVIFVIDNPELMEEPRSCINRHVPFYKSACLLDLPRSVVSERNREYYRLIEIYKVKYPSVIFFSMPDILCDERVCYGKRNNSLLYATRDHLSSFGSKYVGQRLGNTIDESLK